MACLVACSLQADPHSDWNSLVEHTSGQTADQAVTRVNYRVNTFKRISDRENWQQDDYWATPFELLARGGGDCEDLAVAKYYLLREQGIPETNLRLLFTRTFNRMNGRIEPHLVLLYQPAGVPEPRVLDSLRNDILPLSYRRDLIPTAAFDQQHYWLFDRGNWHLAKKADEVTAWRAMRLRWLTQSGPGMIALAPEER